MNSTIEIEEIVYNLEIETAYSDIVNNLEIESSFQQSIEISTGGYTGAILVNNIIGLDDYLSNFIDDYEIDCGSP